MSNYSLHLQISTEPVAAEFNIPTIDKFEPQIYNPRLFVKIGIIAAITAGSFFSVPASPPYSIDIFESRSAYGYQSFHYQASAEPPYSGWSEAPPVTLPDRLDVEYENIFPLKKIPIAAIQAGSFFFVRHLPTVETVTPDKWIPKYPDYLRANKEIQDISYEYNLLGDESQTESIFIDKWNSILPDIQYEKKYLDSSIISGSQFQYILPTVASIDIDEWKPNYPDQLLPVKNHFFTENYTSLIDLEFIVPFAELDSWLPSYPDQVYLNNFIQTDIFTFVKEPDPETIITCDKWVPNYPSILLVKDWLQQQIQSGSFFIGDIPREEIVDLSKILINQTQYFYKNEFLPDSIQSGSFFMGDIPRLTTEFRIHVWQRIA